MKALFAVKHSCFSCHNGNKTHSFSILLIIFVTAYLSLKKGRKNTIAEGTIKRNTEQIFNKFSNEAIQIKGVAEQ